MIPDFPISVIEKVDLPKPLKLIYDPPSHMYARGDIGILREIDRTPCNPLDSTTPKVLCVVGSRQCSEYGHEATKELIYSLAGKNVIIVSGLAIGIDSLALRYSLDVGLRTIAFPGSGLDDETIYPRQSFDLAKEILSKGGLLLSTYSSGLRAQRWMFPLRNRLMAGISDAVLVVECGVKSGSMSTASNAQREHRDVLAVTGSIFSPRSEGPHELIRQGATPITSALDLTYALRLGFATIFPFV